MRILFLHPNFPAQFRHLATALAKDPNNEVVFCTACKEGRLSGVRKILYTPVDLADIKPHPYLRMITQATLTGERVRQLAIALKKQDFVPDVIMGHSGWGPTLFMKDTFPQAELICYFEWFYHAHGSDLDFDPAMPVTATEQASLRLKNAPFLIDLYGCDRGITPTHWQHQQFPAEFHSKIAILHDGIDTQYFQPNPTATLVIPSIGLDLSHANEIVTYATRGMEPYRGFPQFMEAAAQLQQKRPHCHIVIVGTDRVAYGPQRRDGKTYREVMLETLEFDQSRLHFTGHLPYSAYLQVLQASSAHIYLTYPFVLSWSMMEAMATGCAIVGSKTPPVEEVITDGVDGLLVDFFSPSDIVANVENILDHPTLRQDLGRNARQTIVSRYNLSTQLPQTIAWLKQSNRFHPNHFHPSSHKTDSAFKRSKQATSSSSIQSLQPSNSWELF